MGGLVSLVVLLGQMSPALAGQTGSEGSSYLPGLGAGLIDGDGEPSLVFSLFPYSPQKASPPKLRYRLAVAAQHFKPQYDSSAPSSDVAITAAAIRGYRLIPLSGSSDRSWNAYAGVGLRHRTLTESWVTLADDSVVAELSRGDIYGHLGLSYRWQRESLLIWLDLAGLQVRAAKLYGSDNLGGIDVLPIWKKQLRESFNDDADQRLRLTLIGVTFIPFSATGH